MQQKTVFFHVGLGKVASTYLQHKFFPKLRGIHYIPTRLYSGSKEIIAEGKYDKYLVSREFDRQLEREVKDFSARYPQAKTIIFLRRHDSWIASQYRRFVKNARPYSFREFIDIDQNTGIWDVEELNFYQKLITLDQHFEYPPQVFFYDDFRKDPHAVFARFCRLMEAEYTPADIDLNPKHTSYNEKQLKVMRRLSKYTYTGEQRKLGNRPLHYLRRYLTMPLKYPVLYGALLMPESWIGTDPLIPQEPLLKIREQYDEDWEKCVAYARQHNVV